MGNQYLVIGDTYWTGLVLPPQVIVTSRSAGLCNSSAKLTNKVVSHSDLQLSTSQFKFQKSDPETIAKHTDTE